MNSITTYDDLLAEKHRLKFLLSQYETEIKTEIEEIKVKLRPLGEVIDFAEKITTKDKSNPLLNKGIEVGINFLLRKVLLRNAGWIVKMIMPVLLRNFISHEVADNNNGWLQKVTSFFKKPFQKKEA